MDTYAKYRPNRTPTAMLRQVGIRLTEAQIAEVDEWGVANGKRSQSEAARDLVLRGLEAVKREGGTNGA